MKQLKELIDCSQIDEVFKQNGWKKTLGCLIPKKAQENKKRISKLNSTYSKFSQEHSQILQKVYENNQYPSREVLEDLQQKLNCSQNKLVNWLKHRRRRDQIKGTLKNPKKMYFSDEQTQIMTLQFIENSQLSAEVLKELSQKLRCNSQYIRNWFCYRRKLLKQLDSRQNVNLDGFVESKKKLKYKSPNFTPKMAKSQMILIQQSQNPGCNFSIESNHYNNLSKMKHASYQLIQEKPLIKQEIYESDSTFASCNHSNLSYDPKYWIQPQNNYFQGTHNQLYFHVYQNGQLNQQYLNYNNY